MIAPLSISLRSFVYNNLPLRYSANEGISSSRILGIISMISLAWLSIESSLISKSNELIA